MASSLVTNRKIRLQTEKAERKGEAYQLLPIVDVSNSACYHKRTAHKTHRPTMQASGKVEHMQNPLTRRALLGMENDHPQEKQRLPNDLTVSQLTMPR